MVASTVAPRRALGGRTPFTPPFAVGPQVQDAKFLARYEVDWWKEDSCYSTSHSNAEAIAQYSTMRDALNATGRPIWFALCGWQTFYATDKGGGQLIGNSWRIGPDTGGGWSAVLTNALRGVDVAAAGVPGPSASGGAWSDGSLLLTPGMGGGADRMNLTRSRSMFGLWTILSFNLLLTGNLTALDPALLAVWGNPEARSACTERPSVGASGVSLPVPQPS